MPCDHVDAIESSSSVSCSIGYNDRNNPIFKQYAISE